MAINGISFRREARGAIKGVFAGIKTTPIKFGGGYIFFNAGSKTMAIRADKVNEKLIRQEKVNIVAQITNDAKAGSYYGVYAVRLEAIEEVLKFFRGRKYFVIMGDSDSDYIYISVYWGHMTYLYDRPDLFCKFLARYVTETALFLGTKTLSIPDGTLRPDEFMKYVADAIRTLAKHSFALRKGYATEGSLKKSYWTKIRRLEVSYMTGILKGAPTMYIPDDACLEGIMKMSKDHKALQTANDAIGALHKVEELVGLKKKFLTFRTSAADIFSKFEDYIKKVIEDYNKKIEQDTEDEVLQMAIAAKGDGPEVDHLRTELLRNRLARR